jgi:competence protein ComEC
VDCGGSGVDDPGDVAANYFASRGESQLDLLVLTHFDSDHMNGVETLFYRMDVDTVLLPDVETEYGQRERVLELAQAEGAKVIFVTETTRFALGETAELTVYPPLGSGTSNEEGLFVLGSAGSFDTLITGDADSFVEKMLVKYYNIPDIELLVVGHHGSAGSTSDELLDGLRPELAAISVGYNSYGHPAAETLERLAAREIRTYRTDEDGSVTIYIRSDGYAAQTEK